MGHLVPEIWVNVGFEKQKERKEVVFFDGLYLKINIAGKRLELTNLIEISET